MSADRGIKYQFHLGNGGYTKSPLICPHQLSDTTRPDGRRIFAYNHGHVVPVRFLSSDPGLVAGIRDCGQGPVEPRAQGSLSAGPLAQGRRGPGPVTPARSPDRSVALVDRRTVHLSLLNRRIKRIKERRPEQLTPNQVCIIALWAVLRPAGAFLGDKGLWAPDRAKRAMAVANWLL